MRIRERDSDENGNCQVTRGMREENDALLEKYMCVEERFVVDRHVQAPLASTHRPMGRFERHRHELFRGAAAFNQPIGRWDVLKVTDMPKCFTVPKPSTKTSMAGKYQQKETDVTNMFSSGSRGSIVRGSSTRPSSSISLCAKTSRAARIAPSRSGKASKNPHRRDQSL